ncbi:efflux transporter outer membrane subunit [Methylocapsa sp. D3K7]|uniref:efflux transporter outer membrane subunit n=1 Tax=Methylocapsa sp. D3K7 TaxID=3041435 RepID=UPI00244EDD4F|nr:efflux transporter outer membrane subunit [Methylocapsa sp. D3K7]WGJ13019.1 efflux transporter outer membrane subunit [Methylocapsa sp. D3K7]
MLENIRKRVAAGFFWRRGTHSGVGPGLAAVLLAGLTGCAVGPDFAPPVAPVADHWLEWRNKSLQSGPEEYRDWWGVFHDPILDRLIDIAYSQNLTLLSAGTKVLQARAELGVAIGEFFPQKQQAVGAVTYNLLSQANPAANPTTGIVNFWADAIGVKAAWELDFWGKFRRGVESADSAYLASIASYDDVLVTLLGDVATTYTGIRTLETQIAIARENIVKQQGILTIARDRYKGGAATMLDVYQAQNVLGATQATVPQLTIQLQKGLNALRVQLGIAPEPLGFLLARGTGRIPVAPQKVVVGVPADLLRRRPDIRTAELRAAAQSAQIGVAEADLYPAISITGSFGGIANNVGGHNLLQVFQPIGRSFSVGPAFQWNLLNYGQITNNVRLQDATLQQYLVDYQNTVLKAQQEVENGISSFLLSRVQAEYLRRSVVAASGALHIATLEYQQGTRDFVTVLTAEQNLYQAQNNLVMATGNISTGLVSVFRALGGGWQIRDGNGFVNVATSEEMRQRTNWGQLLPPAGEPPLPAPGLPGPEDRGPTVRAPEW